jgi:5-dehydro-2-deoxygluconokinase
LRAEQEETLLTLAEACRRLGREYLLEIIASRHGQITNDTAASVLRRLYAIGLQPDWWKLEAQPDDAAWAAVGAAIESGDRLCRGIVVLGLEAPLPELTDSFAIAARNPWVKGFAVGRSIFAEAAERWLAGTMTDAQAVTAMADKFRTLVAAWQTALSARKAA